MCSFLKYANIRSAGNTQKSFNRLKQRASSLFSFLLPFSFFLFLHFIVNSDNQTTSAHAFIHKPYIARQGKTCCLPTWFLCVCLDFVCNMLASRKRTTMLKFWSPLWFTIELLTNQTADKVSLSSESIPSLNPLKLPTTSLFVYKCILAIQGPFKNFM